jgi:hypothetical protein
MDVSFTFRDFLSFDETGEEDEYGFSVISVKFLGVEVERSVLTRWGTDIFDQDIDDIEEKVSRMLKLMWETANKEETP